MEIPFLQAKYFFQPVSLKPSDWLVIHTADVPQAADRAEWLMKYCAANDRRASWNFALDCDSITQSVLLSQVAYHAGRTANWKGIGVELAMGGAPSAADWETPYARKTLQMGAFLFAGLCKLKSIPPVELSIEDALAGRRGIITHARVCEAFPVECQPPHFDPGPHFPMDSFLADVSARLASGAYQETWR